MATLTKRRLVLRAGAMAAGILFVLFLSALAGRLSERNRTVIAAIQTAHVRHILGPQDIDSLGSNIAPDSDVSTEHAVVFSAGGVLRVVQDVDAARPRPVDVEIQGEQPQTIALAPDDSMLGIAGGYFGALDRNGQLTQSVPMPFNDMRLAPSVHPGAVYLLAAPARTHEPTVFSTTARCRSCFNQTSQLWQWPITKAGSLPPPPREFLRCGGDARRAVYGARARF